MASSGDWRSALGFSDRLGQVTKITTALQDFSPTLSATDARRTATLEETRIYSQADSVQDYEEQCKQVITTLAQQTEQTPIPQNVVFTETASSPTGMTIGKYKHASYHEEGLFSVVYKSKIPSDADEPLQDVPHGGVVALKVTTPSTMEPPHDSRREAKILQMSNSSNVIPLLEAFREAGTRFVLVFPFMPYDMSRLLQEHKLSPLQIKRSLQDLFTALDFIHSHDIIHRDVKPSNILLKSLDGPAYLSDFGISWAPTAPGSEAAASKITDVGTTCYRPPELLFGNKSYTCSLDLWAAGCTVAEAFIPDHTTLFDSGELGSDLALISSIFKKLGTPNLTVWPEAADFPDYGKVQFYEYPPQPWETLLPNTSSSERDIVSKLVRYESGERMIASKVLKLDYFAH